MIEQGTADQPDFCQTAISVQEYQRGWREFRRVSDETAVLSEALVAALEEVAIGAGVVPSRIIDIGAADGDLLGRIVRGVIPLSRSEEIEVVAIDPSLDVAGLLSISHRTQAIVAKFGNVISSCPSVFDGDACAVFASHSAYYLDDSEIQCLASIRAGLGVFIVLDAPDSILPRLWRTSNPAMSSRSTAVRHALAPFVRRSIRVTAQLDWTSADDLESLLSFMALTTVSELPRSQRRTLIRHLEKSSLPNRQIPLPQELLWLAGRLDTRSKAA